MTAGASSSRAVRRVIERRVRELADACDVLLHELPRAAGQPGQPPLARLIVQPTLVSYTTLTQPSAYLQVIRECSSQTEERASRPSRLLRRRIHEDRLGAATAGGVMCAPLCTLLANW